MHILKTITVFLFCLFMVEHTMAQRTRKNKSALTRFYHNNKPPGMNGRKTKLACPVFENSEYPFQGIGFKFGDPFGLTYKYYPNKRFSVALDFGKASSGLYNRYFREKFQTYTGERDTLGANSSLTYSSHRVRTDFIGEFKVLYHLEAENISPGLQVYLGVGWEWKSTKLAYNYFYNTSSPNGGGTINEFRSFDRHRITMGPQAVLGIEYAYFQLPLSAFMEIEYFTDIQADPGWQRFEGGVGMRYIF